MSVSIRLSDGELAAIKEYAAAYDMTVSECIRRAVLEQVETEYDLKVYAEAYAEFRKNPETYTHEQVKEELGLA